MFNLLVITTVFLHLLVFDRDFLFPVYVRLLIFFFKLSCTYHCLSVSLYLFFLSLPIISGQFLIHIGYITILLRENISTTACVYQSHSILIWDCHLIPDQLLMLIFANIICIKLSKQVYLHQLILTCICQYFHVCLLFMYLLVASVSVCIFWICLCLCRSLPAYFYMHYKCLSAPTFFFLVHHSFVCRYLYLPLSVMSSLSLLITNRIFRRAPHIDNTFCRFPNASKGNYVIRTCSLSGETSDFEKANEDQEVRFQNYCKTRVTVAKKFHVDPVI